MTPENRYSKRPLLPREPILPWQWKPKNMNAHAWLLATGSTGSVPMGNQVLGVAMWVGVAIITLALLILMRTRWGQVQPLSKCVVLSVFAHLLLVLFAYGTRLLDVEPSVGGDDAIQLAFVATDRPPREGDANAEPTPWEDFLPGETPEPAAAPAQRLQVDANAVARTAPKHDWKPPTQAMPADTAPIVEPARSIADHQIPTPRRPAPSVVQAAPIEQPRVERHVTSTPTVVPMPIGPQRMEPPAARHSTPERSDAALPTEVFAMGSRMQQLVDVDVQSETADARASNTDQLLQSQNRGASDVDSSGIAQNVPQDGQNGAVQMVALPASNNRAKQIMTPAPALIQQAVAAAPRRLGDGQPLPEAYRLRSMPQREEVAVGLGASARSAVAVDAALAWLAAEQERDGRWDADRWGAGIEHKVAGHDRKRAGTDADTGITGLAILTLLANGQTHLEGKYRKNVQRGLEYLLRSQAPDGDLAGSARLFARMYCHGMASLALTEALALTGDVRIRPFAERAVEYTVNAQHPTTGGWRYQPADQGDMSQFGWQVMALKSAALAGIKTPQKTREGMLHFLQRCEQGRRGGLCGYQPGSPSSRAMTAEALVCRYFLDLAPNDDLVKEATGFIGGELPQSGAPNLYYWYYGTLAMFQVQGPEWQQWNSAMQRQLLRLQRTDGHLAGSWDSDTVWGSYGGRVYSTAMATLCLEVYYRYLPVNAMDK